MQKHAGHSKPTHKSVGKHTVAKPGVTKKQLNIPADKNIPIGLLEEIKSTDVGRTAHNPTKTGKRTYMVTPLMKKRAVAALNLR